MRRWPAPLLLASTALVALPGAARAQNILPGSTVTADPVAEVDHALGSDHPVFRRAVHHTGGPHTWTVPLTTTRGQCYELLGLARGASPVSVEVHARNARIGEALPLANSTRSVVHTRFCVSLPGRAYALAVHTEGAADWALALRAAPPEEAPPDPGAASRERLAIALANNGAVGSPAPRDAGAASDAATSGDFPIGGTESDYVGTQIRNALAGRAQRGIIAAVRETLATNQARDVSLALVGGHCVLVIAAGVPSASDLDVEITDPAGNRVAQDAQHRGTESVPYCPPYSGAYRVSVRMRAGFGMVGIQAFEVH